MRIIYGTHPEMNFTANDYIYTECNVAIYIIHTVVIIIIIIIIIIAPEKYTL